MQDAKDWLKAIFSLVFLLWKYGLWSFSSRGYKIRIYFAKNQHTLRKLLNFEFWINSELSKIVHHFSNKVIQKLILSKSAKIVLILYPPFENSTTHIAIFLIQCCVNLPDCFWIAHLGNEWLRAPEAD